LPEELLAWNCRVSQWHCPGRNIGNHAGLGADLNEVLQNRRVGGADLRHNNAAASNANIVADLHQVIDARPAPMMVS